MNQLFVNWKLILAAEPTPFIMRSVTGDMMDFLKDLAIRCQSRRQSFGDEAFRPWVEAAWACLELIFLTLEREHKNTRPEMACQRSGRCCSKQVPRVSVFELERMANAIARMSPERQMEIKSRCRESIEATYQNSITGAGVPCPMLEKDAAHGMHSCAVHRDRPIVCRAFGMTTPLSWDCPLWQVYKNNFPVQDPELAKPALELFAYCRRVYAEEMLDQKDSLRQMMLVGSGILALFGEPFPRPSAPVVTAALGHTPDYSPDLYLRRMNPPPTESKTKDAGI